MTRRSAPDPSSAWTARQIRRRRRPGARIVAVVTLTLVLGALLNAAALHETAAEQPAGWQRDLALAATGPLSDVAAAAGLDEPRRWLVELLHDPDENRAAPIVDVPVVDDPSHSPAPDPDGPRGDDEPDPTPTAAPSADPTGDPTADPTPDRLVATPSDPVRVWIGGDSMTETFGPELVNLLLATDVAETRHHLEYSSGLTRPDFYDWPARLAAEIAEWRPDVVVVMLGANDGQRIHVDGQWVEDGTDAFVAEYRSRVAATMRMLADRVPVTYWIGQPHARSDSFTAKMRMLDEIYRTEAARVAEVHYIDTVELFAPDGGYQAYLPDRDGDVVLMRRNDGIHLTTAGGHHLAAFVLDAMRNHVELPR